MAVALIALLLAQDEAPGPDNWPLPVPPPPDDAPLVIPPPDGPVPETVPKGEDPAKLQPTPPLPRDVRRAQLVAERQLLLDTMPGYLVPTVVTTLGGLALLLGGTVTAIGLDQAIRGRPTVSFYASVPVALLGLAGFVFGLIWERERFLLREPFVERIEDIEAEIGW